MKETARKPIRRALVSLSDKSRSTEIGQALSQAGVEIVATGSTAQALTTAGFSVIEVSTYTGFPEIMDGRVKTLHPRIHGGILADQNNSEHISALEALDIAPFDLVVINLYPFTETVAKGATFDECIEQIDIGGPTLLRAAAKNHESVAVVCATDQYDILISALHGGGFSAEQRRNLALAAFRTTAEYDLQIATWLGKNSDHGGEPFPEWLGQIWNRKNSLRYGENPHQRAALYSDGTPGIVSAEQLHGKEMSFNNYADAQAAWRSVIDHQEPCVAIIKHANPCGIALGDSISQAYQKALNGDPVSAFGGVVAANRTVTADMATLLAPVFTEVLIAPDYEPAALELLSKKPSLRILKSAQTEQLRYELRPLSGGVLVQEVDLINAVGDDPQHWRQVTGAQLSQTQMADLIFAWRSIRSVKSNAIVIAREGAAVGIGMGQVNRVDASRLAVERAGQRARGAVAASDAFFPFADGLEILAEAGVVAIVQPGGSVRDDEVIAAAQKAGIAMFLTGTRHFSHA